MAGWNPWHGCHKLSAGCANCYVYRMDARYERESSVVKKTADFGLPVRRGRDGQYKLKPGEVVYTCFTSDFFVEDAHEWRPEAWRMMRERGDLIFFFITKRIDRFAACIPPDWGGGYENVHICCTCENQEMADYRLPLFKAAPIKHKSIILEPLLGPVDLSPYLGAWAEDVTVGGESGPDARWCDYGWVLDIRRQCVEANVTFYFRQTGARFIKDAKRYAIPRRLQHAQAAKAGIDFIAR